LSAAAAPTIVSGKEKHALTRSTDDSLAGFGFIEGFEGDATAAQKYKDFKVDSIAFSFNRRKNVTMTVTAYGNFQTEDVGGGWVEPDCVNNVALKGRDCAILINSVDKSSLLWQAGITLNNAVPDRRRSFPIQLGRYRRIRARRKADLSDDGAGPRQPRRYALHER
jgi:hypothetical protein